MPEESKSQELESALAAIRNLRVIAARFRQLARDAEEFSSNCYKNASDVDAALIEFTNNNKAYHEFVYESSRIQLASAESSLSQSTGKDR